MERLSDAALAELAAPRRCSCHVLATTIEVFDDEQPPDDVRCPLCNRLARRVLILVLDSDSGGCVAITEAEIDALFADDPFPEDAI